jgi:hypothetical protein
MFKTIECRSTMRSTQYPRWSVWARNSHLTGTLYALVEAIHENRATVLNVEVLRSSHSGKPSEDGGVKQDTTALE